MKTVVENSVLKLAHIAKLIIIVFLTNVGWSEARNFRAENNFHSGPL